MIFRLGPASSTLYAYMQFKPSKMDFVNVVRSLINATLTPQPLDGSNNNNFRTTSSLWLKTFALRMAVITAYGHLGSLPNLSTESSTSLSRMLILIFLPGATLFDFLGGYCQSIFDPIFNQYPLNYKTFRHALMIAAGLRLPCSATLPSGISTLVPVPIAKLSPTYVTYT